MASLRGAVVDDEPEFFPESDEDAYVQSLIPKRGGFITLHSETGFITDPDDGRDLPWLRAIHPTPGLVDVKARRSRV